MGETPPRLSRPRPVLAWVGAAALLAGCAAAPGPALADGDDFAEGFDAAEEMPGEWRSVRGTWDLVDLPDAPSAPHAVLGRSTGADPAIFVAAGHGSFGVARIEATFRVPPAGLGGLVVRFIDDASFDALLLDRSVDPPRVRWIELVSGVREDLAEWIADETVPEGWWSVVVWTDAGSLAVEWEDGSMWSGSGRLEVGRVGFYSGTGHAAAFDDLRVEIRA